MGRKVHPYGFRLGYIRDWKARWYAEGQRYVDLLMEDIEIHQLIREDMGRAGISDIEINRYSNEVHVTIWTARPGIVIGRKGVNINALKADMEELTGKRIKIDVEEEKNPELNAFLVCENIADQLGRRISHRRAMKQAISRAMRAGAEGIKVACSGRLAGAEMARREWLSEGKVPLHTLRADIDYAQAHAWTTHGRIGVKVWIYKGEILPASAEKEEEEFLSGF